MAVLRRLFVLAACMAGAAVLAAPGFSARNVAGDEFQLGTPHFVVHYQSDSSDPLYTAWAITLRQAGDIAALAEHAYTLELADGFPAPPSDSGLGGDDRIDIYILDNTTLGGALGLAVGDTGNPQTSASIYLNGEAPAVAFTQHTIAHEIFHIFQFGVWASSSIGDYWLYEASAEWMGYRVDNYLVDQASYVSASVVPLAINAWESASVAEGAPPAPFAKIVFTNAGP